MIFKQVISLIIMLTFISAYPAFADSLKVNSAKSLTSNSMLTKIKKTNLSKNLNMKINAKDNKLIKSDKLVGGAAQIEKKSKIKNIINFIKVYFLNKKTNFTSILKLLSSMVLIGALIFWIFVFINWVLKKGAKSRANGLASSSGESVDNEDVSSSVYSFIKHRIRKKI